MNLDNHWQLRCLKFQLPEILPDFADSNPHRNRSIGAWYSYCTEPVRSNWGLDIANFVDTVRSADIDQLAADTDFADIDLMVVDIAGAVDTALLAAGIVVAGIAGAADTAGARNPAPGFDIADSKPRNRCPG